MTMTGFWGKLILARWFRNIPIVLLIPAWAGGADLAPAKLGQGINAYKVHDFAGTVQQLSGLDKQLPKLTDYVTYHLGSAQMQTSDLEGALKTFNTYAASPVASSPFAGRIAVLHARALIDQRQPASSKKALDLLQTAYKNLPQPDGDFALGLAYEAMGEKLQAALAYSKVYYAWPNTDLAAQSSVAMERLRAALGKDFPAAPPNQQLERCRKWIEAREYAKARLEYTALSSSLAEPDRDQAKVGMGAADYHAGDYNASFRYLKTLHIPKSDAEAKRLYYLTESARRMGDDGEMMDAVKKLNETYADSPWRLKALVAAGNRFLLTNDRDKYAPLFRAASDSFPSDSSTAYCHWKVAWDAYLGDKPERVALLREQIERYPTDNLAATALYFLARNYERASQFAEARALYERLSTQFPHYFYGVLARERMKEPKILAAKSDGTIAEWLDGIDWAEHRDFSVTEPNAATRQRIDRSRLLILAGLSDLADAELRFGAKTDEEQPHLLAMELARSMPSPFYSLRIMKSFNTDYLSLPTASAPLKFWQFLFPLPYRDEVSRFAKERNLDPYLVAALIRQETEFNPGARSGANAYGLMQLIPSTGKMVGRQHGIAVAGTRTLLDPSTNIQLGTHYLRSQLDEWGGDWTQTLAAYNAGPGRVRQWLTWSRYREPAEFVESIPFTETREYVQAVLRNADMYRTVYGAERRPAAVDLKDDSDVPPVQLASLPLAARTPGGGAKTSIKARVKTGKKTVAKKRRKKERPS